MKYIHFFFTLFTSSVSCHIPVNNSEIIIIGGHVDSPPERDSYIVTDASVIKTVTDKAGRDSKDDDYLKNDETKAEKKTISHSDVVEDYSKRRKMDDETDVLFVPVANSYRDVDKVHSDTISDTETVHDDAMRDDALRDDKKSDVGVKIGDVMDPDRMDMIIKGTEAPSDILFVQGRNDDKQSISDTRRSYDTQSKDDTEKSEFRHLAADDVIEQTTVTTPIPLDCTNLNCDSTVETVCGGKMDRNVVKYRLFRNECFYRKVNCAFNNEYNRYTQVDAQFCANIASVPVQKPEFGYPMYFPINYYRPPSSNKKKKEKKPQTRRSDGRRSMATNFGGTFCAHECPSICTDAYEPECAVSANGERRTFQNHCQLDLLSCRTLSIWRRRPLAECTGGKKADMHQNRAFIDWMQRTGIVDRKGRLNFVN